MRDITEFVKWQIVGALLPGASVTETSKLLGYSWSTVSRTMTEFKKHGKTSTNRSNSDRTSKPTDRDRRASKKRIMGRMQPTTASKVTAELNQRLDSPVSTKTCSIMTPLESRASLNGWRAEDSSGWRQEAAWFHSWTNWSCTEGWRRTNTILNHLSWN